MAFVGIVESRYSVVAVATGRDTGWLQGGPSIAVVGMQGFVDPRDLEGIRACPDGHHGRWVVGFAGRKCLTHDYVDVYVRGRAVVAVHYIVLRHDRLDLERYGDKTGTA